MNLRQFWGYEFFHAARMSLTVSDVTIVFIVLIFAYLLSSSIRKVLLKKAEQQTKSNAGRFYTYSQLIKYTIFVFTLFIILEILGIHLTSLTAGGAALLVGLGFGLQHTFNDFVSGIIILWEGSLQVGNIIEIQNIVGRVKHIGIRTSKITTRDGVTIIVPNSKLVSENVVNWSHQQVDRTRFMIRFSVSVDSDPDLVQSILL